MFRWMGRRGAVLLVSACSVIAYGLAMFASASMEAPSWWPASVHRLFGISVPLWGVVWMAVGVFLLFGVPRRWPDWAQFAAGIALFSWWSFAALIYTINTPGTWGFGATYAGLALILLVTAGWEEPP